MTETGLLLAMAAFLVLLYAFIWMVVRSSAKQVGVAAAPPPRAEKHEVVAPLEPPALDAFGSDGDVDIDLMEARDRIPEPDPPSEPPIADPTDASPEHEPDPAGAFDLSDAFQPRLVIVESPTIEQGREFPLAGGMTIGRSPSSGVLVEDDFVSHMHARIMRRGQFYFISDLGSTNGTAVNGKRVDDERQLRVRDEIQVGETLLRYEE